MDTRDGRLAELVVHLTDCDPHRAINAVRFADRPADPLEVVARAMVKVRRAPQIADLRDAIDLRIPHSRALGSAGS